MAEIPIGIVTISDRASAGVYEDKGGPGIEAALGAILATRWRPERRLVPDEVGQIEAALRSPRRGEDRVESRLDPWAALVLIDASAGAVGDGDDPDGNFGHSPARYCVRSRALVRSPLAASRLASGASE